MDKISVEHVLRYREDLTIPELENRRYTRAWQYWLGANPEAIAQMPGQEVRVETVQRDLRTVAKEMVEIRQPMLGWD